jgi:hypothetical protein
MKPNEAPQDILEFLNSIRSITANYKIVSVLARIMWRLLELISYLLAVLTTLFAFVYVTPGIEVVKTEDIKVIVVNENITVIVYVIRFFLTLMAAFMLIPALLIRKIRKRNRQIEKINDLVVGRLAKMKVNG